MLHLPNNGPRAAAISVVRAFDLTIVFASAVVLSILGSTELIWARRVSRWSGDIWDRSPTWLRRGGFRPTLLAIRIPSRSPVGHGLVVLGDRGQYLLVAVTTREAHSCLSP